MTDEPTRTPAKRSPMAGGALLAISILTGAGIGIAYRQSTLGLLIGTAVGLALAVLVWAIDRRRR